MTSTSCYHCGLPVLNSAHKSIVLGNNQMFCCHGCQAVCEAIVAAGHGDFYRYRNQKSDQIDEKKIQRLTEQLSIYDHPDVQKDFIRRNEKTCSAWVVLEEIRCAACLWLNERTLRQLTGVVSVQMDYSGQQAHIVWDSKEIKFSEILKAISNIGYIAHPFDPSHKEALNAEQQQRSVKRLIFAVLLGMIVMQTSFSYYFFAPANDVGGLPLWVQISRWTSLFMCAALLAYPGKLFFVNAWRDLKNKTIGMDVPVALGLSLAWLGSLVSVLTQKGHVYFESIAMFVVFLLFARHVELKARIAASSLMDSLSKIIPKMARLFDGKKLVDVAAIELKAGDLISIKSGDTVPVDAYLCSTKSSFDESLLTGESKPIVRYQNDIISSGAINIDQSITLKVKNNEAESTLSHIQQLARKSMRYKPIYIAVADQVASYFVATILFIASVTLLAWLWLDPSVALDHTIAVLIVTCPCALSLASPVALSMGAAALTRLKMVATRMTVIEKLAYIDTVVFDKTGTLTKGKVSLNITLCTQKMSKDSVIQIAASLEQESSHPFAQAFIVANKIGYLTFDSIQFCASEGVEGHINKKLWRLGKQSFTGVVLTVEQQYSVDLWHRKGHSSVYLSNEDGCQAIFIMEDPIRKGVLDLIAALNDKTISIISGDQQDSVNAVAKQLNITQAHGGLSPNDKLKWIKKQQAEGHKIMMFGDGINDAPTLAAADVSISFSGATELAQIHSDLIILKEDFCYMRKAFRLMLKTRQIIRQNLTWAIVYNLATVPAAAIGLISPWMAAIGMSLSSLIVVINSMRLKKDI